MTSPSGPAGGPQVGPPPWLPVGPPGHPPDVDRFGVRCSRCGRTQPADRQPAVQQWPYCVYCAAPLLITTWVATPPLGLGPAPRIVRVDPPYVGPPRYGRHHPGWGFPPVAKLHAEPVSTETLGVDDERSTRRMLSAAIVLLLTTGLACVAAAVAEMWRFALLLDGRTAVLPADAVRASDFAVVAASMAAGLLGIAALLTGSAAARVWYRVLTKTRGLRPARSGASITARLLVPGWNLYGVGQVLVELLTLVFRPESRSGRAAPRRTRRLVTACWVAWVVNGVIGACLVSLQVLAALPGRFGSSEQFAADLVQVHVAVDIVAAVTAGLFAAALAILRNEWWGGRAAKRTRWTVAPPISTARNRRPPVPEGVAAPDSLVLLGASLSADSGGHAG